MEELNQDMWWERENSSQYQCYNDLYYESYNDDTCDDPYHDDCWWTDDSTQSQHHESPCFLEDHESDESSFSKKLDQMLDILTETFNKEEDNSKSISVIEKQLEHIAKNLNQQPSDNLSNTTLVNEVTFPCSDKLFDNKVHKLTQPELELVVEDYVSLNDQKTESISEIKEVEIELDKYNEDFHELEESKVGEGFVEANTIPYTIILKKHEAQLFVLTDSKINSKYKQTNLIIDRPLLATIYAQIGCHEGAIDMLFGNHKVRCLVFGPTNDSLISGDYCVINTIHDYVYEHTTNMLSDTTLDLEKVFSCNRSKSLDNSGIQHMERKLWNKKHDATHAYKSKMKALHDIKHRLKKFTRWKDA
ncbi:unnamed protein product [Lactuca saligna]|uniref:Uncharacterized protein n=1 Tax=Lactuca saligna TaxID=75948 RepID=A0AA36E292_LACSI|nr:unnamed protein product [Lactuca saligna]